MLICTSFQSFAITYLKLLASKISHFPIEVVLHSSQTQKGPGASFDGKFWKTWKECCDLGCVKHL